jgi:hypothetical protein
MALRCTLRLQAKRGALTVPVGVTRRIRSASKEFSWIFVYRYSLCFAY